MNEFTKGLIVGTLIGWFTADGLVQAVWVWMTS